MHIVSGMEGVIEAAADSSGTVITAMSGQRAKARNAIEKERVALANKETLVCAGESHGGGRNDGAEIVPVTGTPRFFSVWTGRRCWVFQNNPNGFGRPLPVTGGAEERQKEDAEARTGHGAEDNDYQSRS